MRTLAMAVLLALLAVPAHAQMGGGKGGISATIQKPRTRSRRSTTRLIRKHSSAFPIPRKSMIHGP
jgi:hypothetical protein